VTVENNTWSFCRHPLCGSPANVMRLGYITLG
jgi:hypothetical protein